jgi:membrane protein
MTRRRILHLARQIRGFLAYALSRFRRDRASGLAASLAYTSLLSLVPLMAIALAILAAFPVFAPMRAKIESWVFTTFVPNVGEVVHWQVSRFIANAGRLSAAGIVGLGVSAIMLLVTVESALNTVFRVARPRTAMSRLLVYWTLTTLGPLLIGASLSLQGYLAALTHWSVSRTMLSYLAAPLPTLLTALAFTVLFAAVPNRRVRLRDAATGGIVAALLFALLRLFFALYVGRSEIYSSIYGAVAAVPIFLFWMFLSWVVVLIGAEITAALPEWRAGQPNFLRRPPGERRLALALDVLATLAAAAFRGQGAVARHALLEATAAAESDLAAVLRRLSAHAYVVPTTRHRWVLARDLATVSLGDLIEALGLGLGLDGAIAPRALWRPSVADCLSAARAGAREALAEPLTHLLHGAVHASPGDSDPAPNRDRFDGDDAAGRLISARKAEPQEKKACEEER